MKEFFERMKMIHEEDNSSNLLTVAQQSAIEHVYQLSSGDSLDDFYEITLNFHPDRYLPNGQLLLEAIAKDNCYLSQFMTGISNGSLSGFIGGKRWEWESRIFNQAYDNEHPSQRPVYGALNYKQRKIGGAPRFGSAYFRLSSSTIMNRTTFCYPDSCYNPTRFGTSKACSDLIQYALDNPMEDLLDDYIEAQIHGRVDIRRDVLTLVLDPSYRGTEIERIASLLPCKLEWHEGFQLSVTTMKEFPTYRGQEFIDIGCQIAKDGLIDPFLIGQSVNAKKFDEQSLKKVWHYTARYGNSELSEV